MMHSKLKNNNFHAENRIPKGTLQMNHLIFYGEITNFNGIVFVNFDAFKFSYNHIWFTFD